MQMDSAADRTAWYAARGYGLAAHWTTQSLPRGAQAPWPYADAVAHFDVDRMAQQIVESGAAWFLFTVDHAQQYLPFPNATLDRILPGRTCERDLMAELADRLAPHDVRLLFYYTSVATDEDPQWQHASGWLYDPASWAALQYDLVAEIGARYAARLGGWWIDNCYDPRCCPWRWHHLHESVNGFAGLYDFGRYRQALLTGHPDRIVTFNFSGTGDWRSELARGAVDYGSGESNHLDRVPAGPFAGEGGSRWHGFVWMDDFWVHSRPGEVARPRYSDEQVVAYARYVNQFGGMFSYGVAPYQDELIAEATLQQLRVLKRELRGTA